MARPHVWQPGRAGPPLLLLHGTGDNEHGLLELGEHLAPGSPLLSPRGTVLEGTMPRHFRRLREGVFDEADLRVRADELAEFIDVAAGRYGFASSSLVAVGFSNGANMAAALLLTHPGLLKAAILIAAVAPFAEPPGAEEARALSGHDVLISNGLRDPMAPPEQADLLAKQLTARGAAVTLLTHAGGHQFAPEHVPAMREFLQANA
ncbi:alpha/beta hydrolase [Phytoactinopolyspora sp. XMNu-373]|uniref:Alpha/beta hydrolase n=1 Tax=Phytoactinopolyspora mesophila TaxID=2650750 RepID=A0A7K3M6N2_9ACTN|nr:alpha/beta hydrolase [Phytoactinopolyspora mesophila]